MRQRNLNTRSFSQIMAVVEEANADRLIARARTANRLAKISSGGSRRVAYAVKSQALASLAERFPDRVSIALDYDAPGFVLVTFSQAKSGLHAPAGLFCQPTKIAHAACR